MDDQDRDDDFDADAYLEETGKLDSETLKGKLRDQSNARDDRLDHKRLRRAVKAVHRRRAATLMVSPLHLIAEKERKRIFLEVLTEWRQLPEEVGPRTNFAWTVDDVLMTYYWMAWGKQHEGLQRLK
jgi:hypothetical protein